MNATLSIVLFILFTSASTLAQQRGVGLKSSPERRVALVIGNSAYEVAPLKNPVNDAQDFANALRELGFEVTYRENLNQNEMKRAIRAFGATLRDGGVGLFYYAGHGIQVKGVNYLVPVSATVESEEEVEYECIDAGFVLAQMESARNSMNIVILDACRNNPFARSFRSNLRGLAQMNAPSGTLIAYATAPNSVASDGDGRNGVYTQEVLRFIRTPGLSVEEVFKQVRISVRNVTQGKQTPWESSSLTGSFFFSGSRADKESAGPAGPTPLRPTWPDASSVKLPDKTTDNRPDTDAGRRHKVTLNGLSFELQSCKAAGTAITCQLLITNDSSEDMNLYTLQDTQIVTEGGDVFRVSSWQVGDSRGGSLNNYIRTPLISGIPTKAVFRFDRVNSNVSRLSLLRISFTFNTNVLWRPEGRFQRRLAERLKQAHRFVCHLLGVAQQLKPRRVDPMPLDPKTLGAELVLHVVCGPAALPPWDFNPN